MRSVCPRPLAWSIRYPKPEDDPTHSPTTAPMGATEAAILSPDNAWGTASGTRMTQKVRIGVAWKVVKVSCHPSGARESQPRSPR